jgi:hypothetical protein
VAAAAAAVGAAVGAARAIGGHGDEEEAEAPTTEAHSQQEDQA